MTGEFDTGFGDPSADLPMHTPSQSNPLWTSWLFAVTFGVMLFGLVLVFAPGLARDGFSLLVYSDAQRIADFGPHAIDYIELAHAVLGAVMFGWGVALALIVRRLFARGTRDGWTIVAVSVVAWFVPDSAFSLWSGFWQNAVLNLVFLVLFAVPLAATYRAFHVENP